MQEQFPGFMKCLAMMRNRDAQTQEDGFRWLLPHAGEHVDELINAYRNEGDLGLRCWLLELIGSAKSSDSFNILAEQLRAGDERLRHWAIWAIKNLDTKQARTLLWQARSYTFESRKETEAFRSQLDIILDKQYT